MISDSLRKSFQAKLSGDLNTLNQVKSVVSASMAIVETFKREMESKVNLTGSQTDTEKELLESLESLYESSEDVLWSVDMAISDLMNPAAPESASDDLPWDAEDEKRLNEDWPT